MKNTKLYNCVNYVILKVIYLLSMTTGRVTFPCPRAKVGQGKTLFTLSSKAVYGDRMTDIMPHKHCMVCGNAVRPDENFCDELCESKFKSAQRKQQLLFLAFLAIMGLVLFLPSILKMFG